jgi:hypothetical protein
MPYRLIITGLLLGALLLSCNSARQAAGTSRPDKIEFARAEGDSTEYELLIIDPGFDSWFMKNWRPMWYYTEDYLATWNLQYVTAWNQRVRNPLGQGDPATNPFIMEIDYRPGIKYGLELNFKLYQYFRYVDETWGRILSYDRKNY